MARHFFSWLIFASSLRTLGIELGCFPSSSSEWGCAWFIALSHGHFWVRVSLGVAHFATSDSVSTGCPRLLCGKLFILGQPRRFSGCGR